MKTLSQIREAAVPDFATTMINQLGGGRFRMMTGAKDFVFDNSKKSLTFKIGRNAKGVTHVRITLNGRDLYDVEWLAVRGGKVTTKAKDDGIYADMLRDVFENRTGMYTSL